MLSECRLDVVFELSATTGSNCYILYRVQGQGRLDKHDSNGGVGPPHNTAPSRESLSKYHQELLRRDARVVYEQTCARLRNVYHLTL